MNHRNKLLSLALLALAGGAQPAGAQEKAPGTDLDRSPDATHIGRITGDSLVLATGSTFSFTVDTPEDSGLHSTAITADRLPLELRAKDGSHPRFRVVTKEGAERTTGAIAPGDRL